MDSPKISGVERIYVQYQQYVAVLVLKFNFLRIRNVFLSISERYQFIKFISPLINFCTLLIWKCDVLIKSNDTHCFANSLCYGDKISFTALAALCV